MPTQALLFVDQVDSTRQLAEIGDDAMVGVRRHLQQLLFSAVEDNRGRVFGDAGDGIAAVFPSAHQAGTAAPEMLDRAARTHGGDQPPIHLRVGVHQGEVIANGDGFIGMAVHVTARLCDLAPRDHVAASASFARAVADGDDFRVVSYERRVVKGLTEPIDVHLLTGVDDAAPPLPASSPDRTDLIPSTPWLDDGSAPRTFVGRTAIVAALHDVARASEQRVQVALVHGEPGIGKSTLLHRIGRELAGSGHVGLVGRSDERQRGAYRELIEALSHLVRNAPEPLLVDHVLRHGSLVARLIPGLRHRVPDTVLEGDDREPDQFRLFEAVTDMLRAVAARQPIVLLVEDIHWASTPSLDLLRHLTRTVDLQRVFVVASFRAGDATRPDVGAFLGSLQREPNVHRFELGPLGADDVRRLVADAAAFRADRSTPVIPDAEQLRRLTAGNPLFVTEMLRSYETAGEAARLGDGSLAIPDTVQELATLRVDQLGPGHRSILADAAVLGPSFTVADVEALVATGSEPPSVPVLDVLEKAERAGIIESDPLDRGGSLVFHHLVIRDALYESISPIRRRRRHGAAADVIQVLAAGDLATRAADVLAHLELAGQDRPPEIMIELTDAAAADATSRLSLDDAIRFRAMAVAAHRNAALDPDRSPDVARALLDLAAAQTAAGSAEGQPTHVAAARVARAAGRFDLLAAAAVAYGGELKENQAIADVAEPVALIEEALAHETEPTAMRARLLSSLAIWQRQHVPYARRREWVDEALAIARTLEDPATLATVLAEFHRALHGPNVTNLAWEMSDELERLAAELGDDNVALQALNLRLLSAIELAETTELDRVVDQLARVANRVGNIEGRRIGLLWRAAQAAMRGDDETVGETTAVLDRLLAAAPEPERQLTLGALNLVLPWLRGDAAAVYDFATSFAPPGVLALLGADAGRLDDAIRHVAERGGPGAVDLDQNYLFFADVVGMARVATRTGDAELAEAVAGIAAPYRGRSARVGLVAYLGAVDHHLGTLAAVRGQWKDAADHLQAALGQHTRLGARPFEAWSAAALAAVLDADPQASVSSVDTAARLRERARVIADELDLGLVHDLL